MRSTNLWRAALAVAILLGMNAGAIGKPQDEQSLADLQQQVAQLQAQLRQKIIKQSKIEKTTETSERVRDVGRQIVRRNPRLYEQDVDLQIRLYDLSDLFAVSPNYPAVKFFLRPSLGHRFRKFRISTCNRHRLRCNNWLKRSNKR